MPSVRINKSNNSGIYYITMTVKRWYYLFDRHNRWEILLDSLKYCQKNKDLKIYSWIFMLNHIHLIVENQNVSGFIRDFKKFTSKEIQKNLVITEPQVLKLFEEDDKYSFWQPTNMPIKIETPEFFAQKKEYIENNPVKKCYVMRPEYWYYSSANPDASIRLDAIEK